MAFVVSSLEVIKLTWSKLITPPDGVNLLFP